jgi:hypothetical protein
MANSTWYSATNQVLQLARLDPYQSTADFDGTSGNPVAKYQLAAKTFVFLANQYLGVRAWRNFNQRQITFYTTPGVSTYPLDTGIDATNIRLRSFFNQTTTATLHGLNQELRNWEYREFLRAFPDQTIITPDTPTRWVLLPVARSQSYPVWNIQLYPTPDNVYQIVYQATLNIQQMQSSSDTILYPPHYEHALWLMAWSLLEESLGEGKDQSITQLAQKAANEVWLVSTEADDIRKAPRTMRLPRFRGGWWYYNSPQSVDANGNVIGNN